MVDIPDNLEQIIVTAAQACSHPRSDFGIFLIGFAVGNTYATQPTETLPGLPGPYGLSALCTLYHLFELFKRKIECISDPRKSAEEREQNTLAAEALYRDIHKDD